MPDCYLYLALDLAAISVPLLFSFYSKAHFAKTYKQIIPALLIPLIPFIIWDVIFTEQGVWGFNDRYLLGINIVNLPLEEWLFFICIPYACLFTYFALKHLFPVHLQIHKLTVFAGCLLLGIGIWYSNQNYTMVTGLSLGTCLLILGFKKTHYLAQFMLSFMIILVPFFLINGVLTGSWIDQQVVWYNNDENLGIRMGTIPLEDPFYGMLLLISNVVIWEELGNLEMRRKKNKNELESTHHGKS